MEFIVPDGVGDWESLMDMTDKKMRSRSFVASALLSAYTLFKRHQNLDHH